MGSVLGGIVKGLGTPGLGTQIGQNMALAQQMQQRQALAQQQQAEQERLNQFRQQTSGLVGQPGTTISQLAEAQAQFDPAAAIKLKTDVLKQQGNNEALKQKRTQDQLDAGIGMVKFAIQEKNQGLLDNTVKYLKENFADNPVVNSFDSLEIGKDGESFNITQVKDIKEGDPLIEQLGIIPGKYKIKTDGNTKQIIGVDTFETPVAKTQEVTSEPLLFKQGFTPVTEEQVNNPKLKSRIVSAKDTGKQFIKLQEFKPVDIRNINNLDSLAKDLQVNLKKLDELGISPDPITGAIPLVGETLNKFIKSPEWQAWAAGVNQAFQKYRVDVTGAQAAVKELQNLKGTFPNPEEVNSKVFAEKTKATLNQLLSKRKTILDNFENQAFNVSGLKEPPIAETQQKTIAKKGYNPNTNQTLIIYSDGSREYLDGRK